MVGELAAPARRSCYGRSEALFEKELILRPDRILLVHGWWAGASLWSRFEPALRAQGFETAAIDLPLPQPGKSLGRTSFTDHLEVVAETANALDGPIVIGHSVGGLLAQKLVERHDLPACVCLVPAPPRGIFPIVSMELLSFALQQAPAMLLSRPFRPSDAMLRRIDLNCLPTEEQVEVLARMRPAPGRQGVEVGLLGVPVDARRVTTPMLVVGASEDRLIPPGVVRKIARKYGANYREYAEHGHYLVREPGWEQVAADVVEWLRSHTG